MLAKSLSATLCGFAAITTALLASIESFGQVPARPQAPAIAQPQNAPAANALPAPIGANAQDGMQVLDQGPLHEAFAEAVVLEANEGITVQREPPEPINELVPEVRPEGHNIEWIPGYWMWSDQQNDFIWVSGVWRDVPPGRRWVPGNWTALDGGAFQWAPGFWAGEQVQEVQMLPLPPDTVEAGPSSPAPAANYFWVPGCWIWNNGAYGWRAGYWYAGQPNWVWIPDRYCYTPRGVIFVSGYWDYMLANRGLAFAPVWWSRPVWGTPGWGYRPYNAINSSLLLSALFINRHHHHYYFGYGRWNNGNYRPWWQNGGGRGYDPFCSYHRWHDGRNRDDWSKNYRRDFDRFQNDFQRPGAGPSRNQLVTQADIRERQQIGDVKLRRVSTGDLDRSRQQIDQFRNIRDSRLQAENRWKELGGGNLAVGDGNRGSRGPQGREPIDRTRGDNPQVGRDSGKLPGVVDREALRSGGRKLDVGANPEGGRPAFSLPPVERTTAKVPATGGNVARGQQFLENGRAAAERGERNPANAAVRGGPTNGTKFEDLQRQVRQGEAPASGNIRRQTLPGSSAVRPSGGPIAGARPSSDVIRNGQTLDPRGGNGNAEALRPRGGVVRSEDLRRQLNLDGSSSFPQSQGRTMQSRARIEMPQNQLKTPAPSSRPPEMQFRSRDLQVPSAGRSSGQPRMNPGSGQPTFRSTPSGGGAEMRSFRGSSGGGGGGPSMMRSQSGGGGGAAFRGSSGGGGGGGRGNGGGGGGGGRSRR